MIHHSQSEEQTKQIARDFSKTLKGGDIVFLQGELGTGKTTFVRGVAEAFGFTKPVRSPTFTLVNRYEVFNDQIKQILHIDLYRIVNQDELIPLAIDEELHEPNTISFIEWPENDKEGSIVPTHKIEFEHESNGRVITIK